MSLIKPLLLLCVPLLLVCSKWPSMPLGRPVRGLEGSERVRHAKPKVRVVRELISRAALLCLRIRAIWDPNWLIRGVGYPPQRIDRRIAVVCAPRHWFGPEEAKPIGALFGRACSAWRQASLTCSAGICSA